MLVYALLISTMVLINEFARVRIKDAKLFKYHGINTIHPGMKRANRCTWICHNNTSYCKNQHVKFDKINFSFTDVVYFGVIGILKGTGNYGLANIIILVILIPFSIIYMIVRGFQYKCESNKSTLLL